MSKLIREFNGLSKPTQRCEGEEMDCKQARMLISAYIDGELNEAEMKGLNEHLKQCAECMSFYNSVVALKRVLASYQEPKPKDELLMTTLHRLRETKGGYTPSDKPHNCKAVQYKMLELLDGELEEEDAHGLLEQIARCDTCTAVWAQWERYAEAMKSLRKLPVPAHHKVALIERLREERLSSQKVAHFPERLLQWARQAIVATMVIASALLATLLLNYRMRHTALLQPVSVVTEQAPRERHVVTSHIAKEPLNRPIPTTPPPSKPDELAKRTQHISREEQALASAKLTACVVATDETIKPSNINDIKPSLKETSMPMRTKLERSGAGVREFAERVHATVVLPVHHEHERVASQMLIRRARHEGIDELPKLEKTFTGTQATHTLRVGALEATKARAEGKSIAKSLPKYGIGVASGETFDEELLVQGDLEEVLKRWREATELTSSAVSVEGWRMVMGAAFQYRPEIEEVERLNNYFLGRPDIVERVRPSDTFTGANQNKCLYIKLFRLGVQW